jgi:hypothetical protein
VRKTLVRRDNASSVSAPPRAPGTISRTQKIVLRANVTLQESFDPTPVAAPFNGISDVDWAALTTSSSGTATADTAVIFRREAGSGTGDVSPCASDSCRVMRDSETCIYGSIPLREVPGCQIQWRICCPSSPLSGTPMTVDLESVWADLSSLDAMVDS